jgi:outer membrane protein TolC
MHRRTPLALAAFALVMASVSAARAGDLDLEDDDAPPASTTPPPAPPKARTYTLAECLAFADRNHPNIWAARARVGFARAQYDEAKWIPFFQLSASATTGIIPQITGTVGYASANPLAVNPTFAAGYEPFFRFNIDYTLPLYTFGKITAGREAAEANVRLQEWDMERNRQLVRMDVRRAYFGVMAARDGRYLIKEVQGKVERAIDDITKKLEKKEPGYDELDKLRLELYRDEIIARGGDAVKGETYGMAALRFLTGIQTDFDVPDEPLKRPTVPIAPVVSYLATARLFRPEVSMARAGIEARKGQLALQRARFFPDIGLGLTAAYSVAPSVVTQSNINGAFNWNYFYYGFGLGVRWNLDLLPNAARVAQVESQLEEARALERLALGGVAVEVENAYATVTEAKNREERWDHAEHKTKQWIVDTQAAIDLGTKDERALLEPLRWYVNVKFEHNRALMDLNIAMSELARVSGWDSAAPTGPAR